MFKLVFFVPISDAQKVKNAIFETGAGSLGNYSHCSFESAGIGQFKPLAGSNPAIGKINQIERVKELRVEILCSDDNIKRALKALKETHPYEEPAYEIYKIENIKL